MKKLLILPVFLFAALFSISQEIYRAPFFKDSLERIRNIRATKSVVDRLLQEQAQKNHLPSLVYAVIADGQVLYSGQHGFTDLENKITASTSSNYRIASMTKSFTTMAIVRLRDEGMLELDQPAWVYIPEMKEIQYLTGDAPAITIRHLMNHMAGFPEDNPWGDRQLADSDEDLIELITNDISFSNVPGKEYEYSNTGYALLGRIITNVSGMPYQQYINENILKPLGMNNTYWDHKMVPAEKLAHGYRWSNGNWEEETLLGDGSYGAMGGLITSIDDFAKYMQLHMQAWPARSGEESPVLKRSSLREMHSSGIFSSLNPNFRYPGGKACPITSMYTYGLGWSQDCEGKSWLGHSGGLPGFGSNWRIFPEYGIGIVVFANRTYAPASSINTLVMDTIFKMAKLQPRVIAVSPILQERKEQLVKLFPDFTDAETSGIFAENFFPDHPFETLLNEASSVSKQAGKIKKVGDIVAQNQLRGSFIMYGEKANIEVFFTLSPEKIPLIQQLNLRVIAQ